MNRRSVLVVAAVAIVAVLLAVLGRERSGTQSTTTGTEFLPGLMAALNAVREVKISKAGDEAVATLTRGDTGWVVTEKDDYPADVVKLRKALVALAEAHILEDKTADAEYYSRLGVEPIESDAASGVAIAIDPAAGKFPVIILGETSGTSNRFARRANEDRSYLIDKNPDVPRNTAQWAVPDIIDVRGARVERVTIEHADGEKLVISKATPEQSNFTVESVPEGRELLYPGVANVIGNALRELKLEDVARAGAVLGTPDAVTEFRTFDGLIVTMTGAKRDEETWLTFSASAAPKQPAEAETAPTASAAGEFAAAEPGSDDTVQAPTDTTGQGNEKAPDPGMEAAEINARVGGWQYRIPAHQYDQMTRRMSDLLKATP